MSHKDLLMKTVISILALFIAHAAHAGDKALVREVPLAPGKTVEYLDFNGVKTSASQVEVIEINRVQYATYQTVAVGEADSFHRCHTVRAQAERDAFELCRSNGGKNCRLSLLITGPIYHESDCEEDSGADVCSVKAYVIDSSEVTSTASPVGFLNFDRMMNGNMVYPNF
jgi:hypothetical protein